MGRPKQNEKRSENISVFLGFVDQALKDYDWASEMVDLENKRQQDLLHDIEFITSSKDRNKLCTKLHRSRKDRRWYKDIVEETEPIRTFFRDPQNKKVLEQMKQLLGTVRKAENYHENRTYTRRFVASADDVKLEIPDIT